jgi:hypothetical protein
MLATTIADCELPRLPSPEPIAEPVNARATIDGAFGMMIEFTVHANREPIPAPEFPVSPPPRPEPWILVALIVRLVIKMDKGCSQPSSTAYPVPISWSPLAVTYVKLSKIS